MRVHQKATGGNQRLTWYLAQRFRLPCSFEGLVYLSQVFQAETIRTGVEHWRRHPERTSGALILAAERLLAGDLLVQHRLLRPLESAAVRCPALLCPGAALN